MPRPFPGVSHKKTILFFSRGRGHGHAIPDITIAAALLESRPDTEIRFVSYATGAETLRGGGWDVIDIDLPENNAFLPTLYKAQSLIACLKPALVISHEEFAALPAAKICGVRSVFFSAWLPPPGNINADCLADATEVILLGQPGIFPPSHPNMPRPQCVGDIHRKLEYSREDRSRARKELEIAENTKVIMVASGGWATEARAPIADVVLGAFRALPDSPKLLLWFAGSDREQIQKMVGDSPDIRVYDFCKPIERWMVSSDVLISKGTRGLTQDAARLGLPSISLSHGLNPMDDFLVRLISSNLFLSGKAVNPEILKNYIETTMRSGIIAQKIKADSNGLKEATRLLVDIIHAAP